MKASKTMCSWLGALLLVGAVGCAMFASNAHAAFGIVEFDGETTVDEGGLATYTQAGGHPYAASIRMVITSFTDETESVLPEEFARKVQVVLPPGYIANPLVTPTRCTEAQLTAGTAGSNTGTCPDGAQVGEMTLYFGADKFFVPLYNMVPGPKEPAELGARFQTTDFHIHARVGLWHGEYRVFAELDKVSTALPFLGGEVTLWGVPADPSHDPFRGSCLGLFGSTGSCPTEAPLRPFVTMPTACTPPEEGLSADLNIESWLGSNAEASFVSHLNSDPSYRVGPTGCLSVPFHPEFSLQPTETAADSPSGLVSDLTVPQAGLETVGGIAASQVRKVVVTLPQGVSVNPSSVNGLGSCSSAQIGLETDDPASCPNSSKIGSVAIETPLLESPLHGDVYLAAQGDNPFGSLLAIYVAVNGPGIVIKLPGHVETRPDGQLVATFDDNPQVPFSALHLNLFSGPRAALRTPSACGEYTTQVELVPWSGSPPVHLSSPFNVTSSPNGGSCSDNGFAPKLHAGTQAPLAGAFSTFSLRISREDGEQELSTIELTLPKGLLGRLAGIPYCPEAALASISGAEGSGGGEIVAPACPAASQVGTAIAGAGAGPDPLFVDTGRAYLAGPYKGAPLSMVIVAPAVAGPFDLGNVVVRVALHIDPATAQITALSDPIPTIIHGISLDLRDVRINLDRSGFTLNPTSCEPKQIGSKISSPAGAVASPSQPFQVGDCGALGFKPKLNLHLEGATKRSGHPALKAVVTYPKKGAYANIARAQVGLPHSEFLDQGNLNKVCKQAELQSNSCPKNSIYGRVKAWTPLLDKPLQGPVYLGVGFGYELPALVADLDGQVRILLKGKVDTTKHEGIRSTFEAVPDAPISRFVLEMKGGKKYGLLENSENICSKPQRASAFFTAQNGASLHTQPTIANSCKKHKGSHSRH